MPEKTASPSAAFAPARQAESAGTTIGQYPPLPARREFLLSWAGMAWMTFAGANAVGGAILQRFMFPNVLFEPPSSFKAGYPEDYEQGVSEKWKQGFGVWIVRTPEDIDQHISGFYALLVTCTHLGCTPNYLSAESKFKCPCHGSGFRLTGVNFEGPAPRPLERYRIVRDPVDGQIVIDKSKKYQYEKGQWTDVESFLAV